MYHVYTWFTRCSITMMINSNSDNFFKKPDHIICKNTDPNLIDDVQKKAREHTTAVVSSYLPWITGKLRSSWCGVVVVVVVFLLFLLLLLFFGHFVMMFVDSQRDPDYAILLWNIVLGGKVMWTAGIQTDILHTNTSSPHTLSILLINKQKCLQCHHESDVVRSLRYSCR